MTMTSDLLQYLGVALGLAGALLVSQRSVRARRWGFLLWIGSNTLLILWAVGAAAWALLAMYAVYSATSWIGWWNHRPTAPEAGA